MLDLAPRSLSLAATLVLLLGCNGSSPTAPDGAPRRLPARFTLTGTAELTVADGTQVSCVMELVFELSGAPRQAPGMLEYDAVHGGSVRRTVVDAAGDGISLWPTVHGAALVRSVAPDRIEITIPANAGADGRFWRELARFDGLFGAGETATGSWNCAPFDIDQGGWVDMQHTARGRWTLAPAS